MTDEELRQLQRSIDEGLAACAAWTAGEFAAAEAKPDIVKIMQNLGISVKDSARLYFDPINRVFRWLDSPTAAEEAEIDEAYMDFASWIGAEMVRNPEGQYPAPSMPPLPVFDKDTVDTAVARIKAMWGQYPEPEGNSQ